MNLWEQVQRRAVTMIREMEEDRLRFGAVQPGEGNVPGRV